MNLFIKDMPINSVLFVIEAASPKLTNDAPIRNIPETIKFRRPITGIKYPTKGEHNMTATE